MPSQLIPSPILALNRNESFFMHPAAVREALTHEPFEVSHYASEAQHGALVHGLAAGLGVQQGRVTLFHGAEDALVKLLSWHRQASSTVVVAEFSWLNYLHVARGLGYTVRHVPCEEGASRFTTPLAALDDVLAREPGSAIVLLASPNNPTGHALPCDAFAALVARFPRHVFILDGVYDAFESPFALLADTAPNCYFVGSFSKFFGLPGLRVGYAVGACPKGFNLSLGLPPTALKAALAALAHRKCYAQNRAVMRTFAHELAHLVAQRPRGGSGVRAFESEAPFVLVKIEVPELGADAFTQAEALSGVMPKYLEHAGARYLRWGLGPWQINEKIKSYMLMLQALSAR